MAGGTLTLLARRRLMSDSLEIHGLRKKGPVLRLTPARKRRGLVEGFYCQKKLDYFLGPRWLRAEVQIRAKTPRQTMSKAKYFMPVSPRD